MSNIVAMNTGLYNPFQNFDFLYKKCFLSGNTFNSPVIQVPLIPKWLLAQAGLTGEEQIQFLDESIRSYHTLVIPVNSEVNEQFLNPLENKIEDAFAKGYAGVTALTELEIFNWIGKFLYGFVYIEMHSALRKEMTADGLNMSQSLMMKFANLNFMLQNLYTRIEFEDFSPWSITIVKLENEATPFSFRDEINTLTFSLKLKDFGIIACLQDNGTNKRFHQEIIKETNGKALTAEQFEELTARFYYSAYLFNRLPEYTIMPVEGTTYFEAMPLRGNMSKPLFDVWQHKVYAQVLENFWKPWGYVKFEIIKDPNNPMSFFENPCLPTAG
ncbi:hypothetical protein G6M26_50780 [Agrobacterium tumefaciens]|nr:hypothetical protein [Agrobacterium tumefaciens]NTE26836.1 hypothetical protein [Agrobacterium tumefaciens]